MILVTMHDMSDATFIVVRYLMGIVWTAAAVYTYCKCVAKTSGEWGKVLAAVLVIGIGLFPGFAIAGTAVRDIDTSPEVRGALLIVWAMPIGILAYFFMPRS